MVGSVLRVGRPLSESLLGGGAVGGVMRVPREPDAPGLLPELELNPPAEGFVMILPPAQPFPPQQADGPK